MAVGGTAAAIYARHSVSLDVDFVSPYLREGFVLSDRRAVRDYVDVCALVETADMPDAVQAMKPFAISFS